MPETICSDMMIAPAEYGDPPEHLTTPDRLMSQADGEKVSISIALP
jgi:hypothetical protein